MSIPRQTVTIDAEWLLARLEALEATIAQIRTEAAQGVFAREGARRTTSATGINIRLLDWKLKGSEPATEQSSWAWAFAYDQEGFILDAARQLVQEIERYGKVEVNGYEITLGGRDKRLLNRKKLKDGRR